MFDGEGIYSQGRWGLSVPYVPPLPTADVSISPLNANEGNTGTTSRTITVTLSSAALAGTSVNYAVAGIGSNPADASDFVGGVFPSGTLSFTTGATTATVNISVVGDTTVETDETFRVTISSPVSCLIGVSTVDAAILNDDTTSLTPPFATVLTNGWQADYASDLSGASVIEQSFNVTRPGFTNTGGATTYTDTQVVTRRLLWPYGDGTVPTDQKAPTLTPRTVALSDIIYAGDTLTGVTNNSTETSPPPMVRWVCEDRLVVGDTLNLAVAAAHRDARLGKQAVCVKFIITHVASAQVITQTVSSYSLSSIPGQARAVPVFAAAVDISGFGANAGALKVDVEVYPWFGRAADGSIFKSADTASTSWWLCRSIYFNRNVSRATNPPIAVVAFGSIGTVRGVTYGTGSSAGVYSTNPATARATPFDNIPNALAGCFAAGNTAVTGGNLAGCEIWVAAVNPAWTGPFSSTTNYTSSGYALTIKRDPNATADEAALPSFGGNIRLVTGKASELDGVKVRVENLKVTRASTSATSWMTQSTTTNVALDVVLVNCDFNAAPKQDNPFGNFLRSIEWWGGTIRGLTNGVMLQSADGGSTNYGGHKFFCPSVPSTGATGAMLVDLTTAIGIVSTGSAAGGLARTLGQATRGGYSDTFAYFSSFKSAYANNAALIITSGSLMQRVAWVNSLIEYNGNGTGDRLARFSADGSSTNTDHSVFHANTFAGISSDGAGNSGMNMFYDETVGTRRTHRRISLKGNILTTQPTKGDTFLLERTATGNWIHSYGVGQRDNYLTTPTGDPKAYQGLRTAAVGSTRQNPLWVDRQTGSSETGNGAGGGDYHLQSGSPCKGVNPEPLVPYDLDGTARSTSVDNIGAYA